MNTSMKVIFILLVFTSSMCKNPGTLITSQRHVTNFLSEDKELFYLVGIEHTNASIPGYKYYKFHIILDSVLSQSFNRTKTQSSYPDSFPTQLFSKIDSHFFKLSAFPNTLENALCFDFSSEHNIINHKS